MQSKVFFTESAECTVFLCSCEESSKTTARLNATKASVLESIEEFQERERSQYCIHAAALLQLQRSRNEPEQGDTQDPVSVLSLSPLYAAVTDGKSTVLILLHDYIIRINT